MDNLPPDGSDRPDAHDGGAATGATGADRGAATGVTGADSGGTSSASAVPGSSATVRVVHKPRRLPGDHGPAPRIALTWATFFGAGYFPVAPGTAGTAAAIPLWWALTHLSWPLYIAATIVLTLTGIAAADRAGRYYGVADSGHIVIDEVAGYLVTMVFLPRTALAAIVGFFLFRLCDVLKPPPARFFDRDPRWKNGAGVVLDDVAAAVWSWVATWLILLAASHVGLT